MKLNNEMNNRNRNIQRFPNLLWTFDICLQGFFFIKGVFSFKNLITKATPPLGAAPAGRGQDSSKAQEAEKKRKNQARL